MNRRRSALLLVAALLLPVAAASCSGSSSDGSADGSGTEVSGSAASESSAKTSEGSDGEGATAEVVVTGDIEWSGTLTGSCEDLRGGAGVESELAVDVTDDDGYQLFHTNPVMGTALSVMTGTNAYAADTSTATVDGDDWVVTATATAMGDASRSIEVTATVSGCSA